MIAGYRAVLDALKAGPDAAGPHPYLNGPAYPERFANFEERCALCRKCWSAC